MWSHHWLLWLNSINPIADSSLLTWYGMRQSNNITLLTFQWPWSIQQNYIAHIPPWSQQDHIRSSWSQYHEAWLPATLHCSHSTLIWDLSLSIILLIPWPDSWGMDLWSGWGMDLSLSITLLIPWPDSHQFNNITLLRSAQFNAIMGCDQINHVL